MSNKKIPNIWEASDKASEKIERVLREYSKHYTPSLEEFHAGFEFEEFCKGVRAWIPRTMESPNDYGINLEGFCIDHDDYRVKYLDREDIQSLGFITRREATGVNPFLFGVNMDKPIFPHHPELDTLYFAYSNHTSRCILFLQKEARVGISEHRPEVQLFNGYIKNKSELKRLMNQIGIK